MGDDGKLLPSTSLGHPIGIASLVGEQITIITYYWRGAGATGKHQAVCYVMTHTGGIRRHMTTFHHSSSSCLEADRLPLEADDGHH
jgi:hypothetical protein